MLLSERWWYERSSVTNVIMAIRGVFFSAGASAGIGDIFTVPSSWEGPWLSCHPKNARKTRRNRKAGGIFNERISILEVW